MKIQFFSFKIPIQHAPGYPQLGILVLLDLFAIISLIFSSLQLFIVSQQKLWNIVLLQTSLGSNTEEVLLAISFHFHWWSWVHCDFTSEKVLRRKWHTLLFNFACIEFSPELKKKTAITTSTTSIEHLQMLLKGVQPMTPVAITLHNLYYLLMAILSEKWISFCSRKYSFLLEFGVSAKLEVVGLYKTEKRTLDRFTLTDFRCVIRTLPCKANNATNLLFKVRVQRKCQVSLLVPNQETYCVSG